MACGCNKGKNNNRNKKMIAKGKKIVSKKAMPLITVRKQNPVSKKKEK